MIVRTYPSFTAVPMASPVTMPKYSRADFPSFTWGPPASVPQTLNRESAQGALTGGLRLFTPFRRRVSPSLAGFCSGSAAFRRPPRHNRDTPRPTPDGAPAV